MIAALSSSAASARDYYYFNKPGVDREAYLQDRLVCDELAGGAARRSPDMTAANTQIWQNRNLSTGQAAAAAGIASFILSFMAGSEQRRLSWQIERICLADKGYRRFEMDRKSFKEIEAMKDDAARIDRWFALASGTAPQGKVLPE